MTALAIDLGSPCWNFTGPLNHKGYGSLWDSARRRHWPAHRYVWTVMRGPIPAGMHMDHLCRNRACVNPQHLEVVTPRENTLRGETIPARNLAKTHCNAGHPLDASNTFIERTGSGTGRRCLICRRRNDLARRERERAEIRRLGLGWREYKRRKAA